MSQSIFQVDTKVEIAFALCIAEMWAEGGASDLLESEASSSLASTRGQARSAVFNCPSGL